MPSFRFSPSKLVELFSFQVVEILPDVSCMYYRYAKYYKVIAQKEVCKVIAQKEVKQLNVCRAQTT